MPKVGSKHYAYTPKGMAKAKAAAKKSGKKVIIGGGDTACFCNRFPHNFHFVSTGGGASIDYISNGSLEGTKYFDE